MRRDKAAGRRPGSETREREKDAEDEDGGRKKEVSLWSECRHGKGSFRVCVSLCQSNFHCACATSLPRPHTSSRRDGMFVASTTTLSKPLLGLSLDQEHVGAIRTSPNDASPLYRYRPSKRHDRLSLHASRAGSSTAGLSSSMSQAGSRLLSTSGSRSGLTSTFSSTAGRSCSALASTLELQQRGAIRHGRLTRRVSPQRALVQASSPVRTRPRGGRCSTAPHRPTAAPRGPDTVLAAQAPLALLKTARVCSSTVRDAWFGKPTLEAAERDPALRVQGEPAPPVRVSPVRVRLASFPDAVTPPRPASPAVHIPVPHDVSLSFAGDALPLSATASQVAAVDSSPWPPGFESWASAPDSFRSHDLPQPDTERPQTGPSGAAP